ncbi:hypothetical protein [Allorhizocola rhizosphaerae]|uniref:hypothetical protein n=1 Tax=Allorhizocola rhizosphaerae TaxID=1872709 RepID=UPI000E3C690B|nr:hypothetical protein [Allorhizocola rhizosphaerae]
MNQSVDPCQAQNAIEYVAALREVKDSSGLTYRRIQRRAAAAGAWLPASTLGTALNRETLPRPELVDAFLTACDLDREQIKHWLDARSRLESRARRPEPAVGPQSPAAPDEWHRRPEPAVVTPSSAPVRLAPNNRRRRLLAAVLGVVTSLCLAAAQPHGSSAAPVPGGAVPPPGPYHIRVALSGMCLSALPGDDSGFIFQADCGRASAPMALLAGDQSAYRIRTERGCLGVVASGSRAGGILAEGPTAWRTQVQQEAPRPGSQPRWAEGAGETSAALWHCAEFQLEPVTSPLRGYRIRVLPDDLCLGVPADAAGDWLPVLRNHCDTTSLGQIFRFSHFSRH